MRLGRQAVGQVTCPSDALAREVNVEPGPEMDQGLVFAEDVKGPHDSSRLVHARLS